MVLPPAKNALAAHMATRTLRSSLLLLVLCATASSWAQSPQPLQSISSLDVPRYMGRWYEIARFPNWFQRKCISDTSAQYSLLPDGTVRVRNQCRLENGEIAQANGIARRIAGDSSAKLQVRFAPAWLGFLPFVWGDYWVVDLDDRYELAAVSEPGRKYLWILSRTPAVDESRYAALVGRLASLGFDVSKLDRTAHSKP